MRVVELRRKKIIKLGNMRLSERRKTRPLCVHGDAYVQLLVPGEADDRKEKFPTLTVKPQEGR